MIILILFNIFTIYKEENQEKAIPPFYLFSASGTVAPAAAAGNAAGPVPRPRRISHESKRVFPQPVLTLLPYIPMNVMKPPGIRPFLAHGMGSFTFHELIII